jgi:hypothetical protein
MVGVVIATDVRQVAEKALCHYLAFVLSLRYPFMIACNSFV